ncbi:MAG: cytochrome P450 [Myxococcales bacterium]|nr:cytochrome P450 [Myxococcales bacterium]
MSTADPAPLEPLHWRHLAPIWGHPYRGYQRLHARYGPTVAIDRPGRKPIVFTKDEDFATACLVEHHDAFTRPLNIVTGIFRSLVGDAIVSSEGAQWQGRRQRGSRRIRGATLEDDQVELLRRGLGELRDEVAANARGEVVDLLPAIERFTLTQSIRLVCGREIERGPELERLHRAIQTIMGGTQQIADIRRQMFLYSVLPKARKILDAPLRRAIRPSFALYAAYEPDPEVRELLIATFENPSTALSWTLSLLGEHPEHLERVRDEVARVDLIGDSSVTIADIDGLAYTGAVIREALRLRPPIAYLSRRATRDVAIGDVLIERGTHVLVIPYCLHMDPERWPAPERFDPTRFLRADGSVSTRGPAGGRLWSFGFGPRGCPGTRLALQLATAALAVLARDFRWTSPAERARPLPTGRYPWNEKSPVWERLSRSA